MAEESTVKINLVTTADTAGAERVVAVTEKAVESSKELQEQADFLGTTTEKLAQAQESQAEAVVELVQASEQAAEAVKEEAAAVDELTDAELKEQEAAKLHAQSARQSADAQDGLALKLRSVAAVAGLVTGGVALLKEGFEALRETNPEVADSFDRVADTISGLVTTTLSEWFQTWVAPAGEAKALLDSITVALGGETAEMEKARGPMAGYASDKEVASEKSREFAESLHEEALAAQAAQEALAGELELLRARNEIANAKGDNAAAAKKREIDASDASPEEKARQKAAVDAQNEKEKLARRTEERNQEVSNLNRGEDDTRAAARALENNLAAAEARLAELNNRTNLQTQQDAEKAARERTTGAEAARLDMSIARRQDEIDAIAPGDAAKAQEEKDQIAKELAAARKAAADAAAKARQARQMTPLENEADSTRTAGRVEEITARGEAQARAAEEAARKKKEADEQRAAKERDEELARQNENDAIAYERAGDPVKAAAARNRAAENRAGLGKQDREQLTEQQKRRLQLDNEERAAKAKGALPGRDAANKSDRAEGALRGDGLGAAADKLDKATEGLRDGATADEAAKAAQAIANLAPLVGKMSEDTKAQIRALRDAVKLLEQQFKNGRGAGK